MNAYNICLTKVGGLIVNKIAKTIIALLLCVCICGCQNSSSSKSDKDADRLSSKKSNSQSSNEELTEYENYLKGYLLNWAPEVDSIKQKVQGKFAIGIQTDTHYHDKILILYRYDI